MGVTAGAMRSRFARESPSGASVSSFTSSLADSTDSELKRKWKNNRQEVMKNLNSFMSGIDEGGSECGQGMRDDHTQSDADSIPAPKLSATAAGARNSNFVSKNAVTSALSSESTSPMSVDKFSKDKSIGRMFGKSASTVERQSRLDMEKEREKKEAKEREKEKRLSEDIKKEKRLSEDIKKEKEKEKGRVNAMDKVLSRNEMVDQVKRHSVSGRGSDIDLNSPTEGNPLLGPGQGQGRGQGSSQGPGQGPSQGQSRGEGLGPGRGLHSSQGGGNRVGGSFSVIESQNRQNNNNMEVSRGIDRGLSERGGLSARDGECLVCATCFI